MKSKIGIYFEKKGKILNIFDFVKAKVKKGGQSGLYKMGIICSDIFGSG